MKKELWLAIVLNVFALMFNYYIWHNDNTAIVNYVCVGVNLTLILWLYSALLRE